MTYIAQGWKVTDPQALADVGPVPDHETLIEIPEDVLKFYARRYMEQEGDAEPAHQAGPEFRQLFHSFEHTAFRLETARPLRRAVRERVAARSSWLASRMTCPGCRAG